MRVIFGQAGMSQRAWTLGPNGGGLMAQVRLNKRNKQPPRLRNVEVVRCTVGDNKKAFSELIVKIFFVVLNKKKGWFYTTVFLVGMSRLASEAVQVALPFSYPSMLFTRY